MVACLRGGAGSPPSVWRTEVRTEPFASQFQLVEKARQAWRRAAPQAPSPPRLPHPQQSENPRQPQQPRQRRHREHALPLPHITQQQQPRLAQYSTSPYNPGQYLPGEQQPPRHAYSASSALLPPRPDQRQRSIEGRMFHMASVAPPQSEEAFTRLRNEARRLEWEKQEQRAQHLRRERQDPRNIALATTGGNSGVHVVSSEPDRQDPRNFAPVATHGNRGPYVTAEPDPGQPRVTMSDGGGGSSIVTDRRARNYSAHFPEH